MSIHPIATPLPAAVGSSLELNSDEQLAFDLLAQLAPDTPNEILERALLLGRGRSLEVEATALLSTIDDLNPAVGARAAAQLAQKNHALADALEVNLERVRRIRAPRFTPGRRRRSRLAREKVDSSAVARLTVRFPQDVMAMIGERIPKTEHGRGGGVSHWLRCLVCRELGLPEPPVYAEELSPRKERRHARAAVGYATPAPLREAFLSWLDHFAAGKATMADTIPVNGQEQPLEWVLGQLWAAPDELPHEYCDLLELEHGSTFARAARQAKAALKGDEKRNKRFKVTPPD